METKIYNIDSINRNIVSYPNSNNFTYTVESTLTTTKNNIDSTIKRVEPFNEKNIIEMKILSIEIPNTVYFINSTRGNNTFTIDSTIYTIEDRSYTLSELITAINAATSGIVTFTFTLLDNRKILITTNTSRTILFPVITTGYKTLGEILGFTNTSYTFPSTITSENTSTIPIEKYFFLRLNNLGNISNNNTNYVAKIIPDTSKQYDNFSSQTSYNFISNNIKLDQPEDIQNLKISLEDYKGNLISLNGSDFSFTFELVIVNNSILKNYEQIRFYSEPVMERILQAKMLAYYEKQTDNNSTLTSNYNSNLVNMNNNVEYSANGIRNNYSNISSSFFTNMD